MPRLPQPSAALLVLVLSAVPAPAQEKTRLYGEEGDGPRVRLTEHVIGYREDQLFEDAWRLSPDGRSLAYVSSAGGTMQVVRDGVTGRSFKGISIDSLVFSPDSQRLAYVGKDEEEWVTVVDGAEHRSLGVHVAGVVFSPDSMRVAWASQARTGEIQVLVDGAPVGAFDGVAEDGVVFSPASDSYAFVADRAGGQLVVRDGEEGPLLEEVLEIWWSPVGSHLAYAARSNERIVLFLDGEIVGDADAIGREGFAFPEAAERWAIPVRQGDTWSLLVDGRLEGEYRNLLPTVRFTSDGEHLAYLAGAGEGMFLVLDGEPQTKERYEAFQIAGPRIATVRREEEGVRVVLEGTEHALYDSIEGGIAFSPSNQHSFYVARSGEDAIVVRDGEVVTRVRRFGQAPTFFGEVLVFTKFVRGREFLYVDDAERAREERVRHVVAGPGGRLAYLARKGERWSLVVDGERTGDYGRVLSPPLFSPDGSRVAHVAARDRHMYVSVDGELGPPFEYIHADSLHFTGDGAHVAYPASRGEDRYLVVDDLLIDNGYEGYSDEAGLVAVDRSTFFVLASRNSVWYLVELELLR